MLRGKRKTKRKYSDEFSTTCPICGASYEYIYDNAGDRGQPAVRHASLLSILIRLIWRNLRLNAHIVVDLFRKKHDRKQFFVYSCYATSAARVIKPYIDNYPYELSDSIAICCDETYVNAHG